MMHHQPYEPGPAHGVSIQKEGDACTLLVIRELRHPPERVWDALTDPAHLREWAPFDADRSLGETGAAVKLNTVGAPAPQISETVITRAEPPKVLEYTWGEQHLRWVLEPVEGGTKLTLWHDIDRRFIAMGAAGWHICLGVLDRALAGTPIGRIVAGDALRFGGWQRLNAEYSVQFGVEPFKWPGSAGE